VRYTASVAEGRSVKIRTEYVTLAQLLKMADVVATGGEAKWLLGEGQIEVNGAVETQRGKKLRDGDVVTLPDGSTVTVFAE